MTNLQRNIWQLEGRIKNLILGVQIQLSAAWRPDFFSLHVRSMKLSPARQYASLDAYILNSQFPEFFFDLSNVFISALLTKTSGLHNTKQSNYPPHCEYSSSLKFIVLSSIIFKTSTSLPFRSAFLQLCCSSSNRRFHDLLQ